MIGKTLGHYEIIEPLGAGGMGEVYLGEDTRLGRKVAIKVLPQELSADPDRLARLEREAHLLAALNHANIATIHALEEEEGTRFLVLELVKGESLEQRLSRGPLPVENALEVCKQIAEALEAAHNEGIVHRDLKPANVLITPEGNAKVLDFGLAKEFEAAHAETDMSHSPTVTVAGTQAGVILGTAPYMSPEQIRGHVVDKRADIWAFGCVLYEALTGRRAFDRETVADTLAAILDFEPEWNALPVTTPGTIQSLLRRCLRKNQDRRLRDIGDARLEIDDAATEPAGMSSESLGTDRPALWRQALPVAAAVVVIGLLAGLAAWTLWPTPEPPEVIRFEHILPAGQRLGRAQMLALSRDGRQVVYNTSLHTSAGLYLRPMGQLDAQLIPGTEGQPTNPAFSPNGQFVGYFQDGQLKRIQVAGGDPVDIVPAARPSGVSWETDGTILFGQPEGILRVSENGGPSEVVIPARDGELVYGPQLLPDGDSVLFTFNPAPGFGRWREARIVVESIRTGVRKDLDITGSNARYVSTGHLVYAVEDALHAVAFDVDRLAVVGGAASMVQDVARAVLHTTGAAQYAVSDHGTLVYLTGEPDPTTRTLVWVDREGVETPVGAPPRAYETPRISPDGTRVAFAIGDLGTDMDIWTWDLARGLSASITFNGAANRNPVWIDDARVAFMSNRDGSNRVYVKSADGVGDAEPLTEGEAGQSLWPMAVTPDRSRLIMEMEQTGSGRGRDLAVVSLEGSGMIGEPLGTESDEIHAAVSPDGNWIAFSSDRSGEGEYEIYVAPFPDVSGGVPVSLGGGVRQVWHPNGSELFYQRFPDSRLMSVPVLTRPSFDFQPAVELFDASLYNIRGGRHYDIADDGRFLMVKKGEERLSINISLNWFEELKERVPTGR